MRKPFLFVALGVLFSALWSSAAVAAKIGVTAMEPLVLFQCRFLLAAVLLLTYSRLFESWRMPKGKEWINLAIFGFFNITVYLSLFVLAITEVAAGIGSLSTSLSPLMMSLIAGFIYRKRIKPAQTVGLIFGISGVWLSVIPLLGDHLATPKGLVFLSISILSYSWAALFYSEKEWTLSRYAINGWQVLFGGIFLLPFTLVFKEKPIEFSYTAMWSILWLVIPVSILSVNIWLRMLKIDPVKASFFLFLSPIFGFVFASLILNEPFTIYTLIGLILVLMGLFLGQKGRVKS
ncbi:MAG: DMT family transporter [Saprospiraceae bacterium]|nr:DMT family transporter [Saprospiraceae bacterium]MBL0026923.1 DMT family transporter [Saprospiraceae bacterium]